MAGRDEQTVIESTRSFVQETFLYMRPGFTLGEHDRLLEKGILDSMGVLELIEFLKSEFGVEIAVEDITEANLGSLADIARYVLSRNGTSTAT